MEELGKRKLISFQNQNSFPVTHKLTLRTVTLLIFLISSMTYTKLLIILFRIPMLLSTRPARLILAVPYVFLIAHGKSTKYSAVSAADNSTETIFIRNYDRFIGKMLKAKRVRISTNIHQEGAPAFEFDVSVFDLKKFKPIK